MAAELVEAQNLKGFFKFKKEIPAFAGIEGVSVLIDEYDLDNLNPLDITEIIVMSEKMEP